MDINLWFAKDIHNEIITITYANKDDEYTCPICSTKVIPKALNSHKVTPHFAHVDVSKCNGESMIHFWYKHRFIERGDTFKIKTDTEIEFTCKDFDTEVTYQLSSGTYRPDLVVYTECGQEVIFEMANTNKKKVQDYIDKWIELDRVIVEIDIKSLQNTDEEKCLKALYYKGKCFNFNKRDGGYYSTIGKLKEEMKSDDKYDIELLKELDSFWKELVDYQRGVSDIDKIAKKIDSYLSGSYKTYDVVTRILKKNSCSTAVSDYKEYKILDNLIEYDMPYLNLETINTVSNINLIFKKLDERFELKIKKSVSPVYKSFYNGSRKHMYKSRVVDNKYTFELNFYNKKKKVLSIPVTYRFNKIVDKVGYLNSNALKICSSFKHKCIECNSYYIIEEGEFNFFLNKGFKLPKRCKSCRQKRKINNRKED